MYVLYGIKLYIFYLFLSISLGGDGKLDPLCQEARLAVLNAYWSPRGNRHLKSTEQQLPQPFCDANERSHLGQGRRALPVRTRKHQPVLHSIRFLTWLQGNRAHNKIKWHHLQHLSISTHRESPPISHWAEGNNKMQSNNTTPSVTNNP